MHCDLVSVCREQGTQWADEKLEGKSKDPPLGAQRESGPADPLISDSGLQNCDGINPYCFGPPVGGHLLQKLSEMSTFTMGSLSLLQQIFPPRNRTRVSCIAGRFFSN